VFGKSVFVPKIDWGHPLILLACVPSPSDITTLCFILCLTEGTLRPLYCNEDIKDNNVSLMMMTMMVKQALSAWTSVQQLVYLEKKGRRAASVVVVSNNTSSQHCHYNPFKPLNPLHAHSVDRRENQGKNLQATKTQRERACLIQFIKHVPKHVCM